MSLEIHFLYSIPSSFSEKLGAISDELGEPFYQDRAKMEQGIKQSGIRS
jgi:hypothetical protein